MTREPLPAATDRYVSTHAGLASTSWGAQITISLSESICMRFQHSLLLNLGPLRHRRTGASKPNLRARSRQPGHFHVRVATDALYLGPGCKMAWQTELPFVSCSAQLLMIWVRVRSACACLPHCSSMRTRCCATAFQLCRSGPGRQGTAHTYHAYQLPCNACLFKVWLRCSTLDHMTCDV